MLSPMLRPVPKYFNAVLCNSKKKQNKKPGDMGYM